ncbi:MAG: ATP-binding protein [Burkholderiaceae bacterium]
MESQRTTGSGSLPARRRLAALRGWPRPLRRALEPETFTLDPQALKLGKAQRNRLVHALQIPLIRSVGFVILCGLAVLHDLRFGLAVPSAALGQLCLLNLGYAALSGAVLWFGYGRSGRLDLSLLFLHLDLVVWMATLHHVEQQQLLVALLLLIRVSDQVGFGVRRALYFAHVVVVAYLAYALWLRVVLPVEARLDERWTIAATMYLVGIYIALTGRVTERLRTRTRAAVHAARDLVEALAANTRTLEAQAVELEAARLEGERANAAKSRFLAMMSHEIRTPMNGVLGTAELLSHSALDAGQRRLVETAQRSGAAMLALIDDLLDLSRIDAGKLTLHVSSFEPGLLIEDVVQLLAPSARAKGLDIARRLDPRLPGRVRGDALRLRQVLINLLANAIKFTERGHVELRVDVIERTTDAVGLQFEVRDTGPGIDAEHHAAMFEAFTQADASTTRRHGGSGLGLAIVKQLAQLMGGEVGVTSRSGAGATFWLRLRLAIATEGGATGRSTETAPTTPEPVHARVLLAEDNTVNQLVLQRMLELLGCRVDVVGDGRAACAAAATQHYDVILMDLHMPSMDGLQATGWIRATPDGASRRTPIVALSAAALPEDRARCADAGMADFISKPVSLARLRHCLVTQIAEAAPR